MTSDLEQIGELAAGVGVGGVSVWIVRAAWATIRARLDELKTDRDYWRARALGDDS